MNNLQLLIQAAQAAGADWCQADADGLHDQRGGLWNPLTCDETAKRLATTLALEVRPPNLNLECVVVRWSRGWLGKRSVIQPVTPPGYDYHVATRRAIVRAAANQGKGGPRSGAWYTSLRDRMMTMLRRRREGVRGAAPRQPSRERVAAE